MTRGRVVRRAAARAAAFACAIACGLASGGCATEAPPRAHDLVASWINPHGTRAPLRRILVPPFEDRSGYPTEADRVRLALVEALTRRGGVELVAVGAQELRDEVPAAVFNTGAVSRRALIAAARRYRVDGVLFGVIKTVRPYEPFAVSLSVELVAADDGATTWSADASYDAATQAVEEDVRHYYERTLADTRSLEGWRLTLVSPSKFIDYACARIAAEAP
jgi:hypothetical protein